MKSNNDEARLKPPSFQGTDVPLTALMDWLREGRTLDAFIFHHPEVSAEEASFVLEQVTHRMAKDLLPKQFRPRGK